MNDCFIHQLVSVFEYKTYERLYKILKSGFIGSRKVLDLNAIDYESPFIIDISEEHENEYIGDDAHYDRVSLFDMNNRHIKRAINSNFKILDCFSPDFLGIVIKRNVPIVAKEETNGFAIGEVQVRDSIDKEYFVGIVLSNKSIIKDEKQYNELIYYIKRIEQCFGYKLDIIDYQNNIVFEGNLIDDELNSENKKI